MQEDCEHKFVTTTTLRVGCADAGCDMQANEHYCHTLITVTCDGCGAVVEETTLE